MEAYNLLTTSLTCPRCQATAEIPIHITFGRLETTNYRIGDRVHWVPRRSINHGGRPILGNLDYDARATCPACQADLSVKVTVRSDVITGVDYDQESGRDPQYT